MIECGMGHLAIFTVKKILLKSDYNYGFENFKILKNLTFAPKIHLRNSTKQIKSKTFARFEPATHGLLTFP